MAKLHFQQVFLQSSMSQLIWWFGVQETFIIISWKQLCCLIFFEETMTHFFQYFLINSKYKKQHFFETEIFCNIIYLYFWLI